MHVSGKRLSRLPAPAGVSTALRGISLARAHSPGAWRRWPPATGTSCRRPSGMSDRRRVSTPAESNPPRGPACFPKSPGRTARRVPDLTAYRRIPRVAAAQRVPVEPDVYPQSAQCVADSVGGVRVLRGITEKYGFGNGAHAGSNTVGALAANRLRRRASGTTVAPIVTQLRSAPQSPAPGTTRMSAALPRMGDSCQSSIANAIATAVPIAAGMP